MSEVKTVRIVCEWREQGWLYINESDFSSEKHTLLVDPAIKAEEATVIEAAKGKKGA